MQKSKVLAGLVVAAGVAVAATGMATAQDAIAKRKEAMKGVGGAMKTATTMVKGEAPYDAKKAAEAMTTIANGWAGFPDLFPDNSKTGGETTASPKIWEDRKGFAAKGDDMVKAATAAAGEAAKGLDAFKAAHGAVGKSCGGCHEVYRVKKQ